MRKRRDGTAASVAVIIVGVVFFLMYPFYLSQLELRESVLEELEGNLSKRAQHKAIAHHLIGFGCQQRAPVPWIITQSYPGFNCELIGWVFYILWITPQTGCKTVEPHSFTNYPISFFIISFQCIGDPTNYFI